MAFWLVLFVSGIGLRRLSRTPEIPRLLGRPISWYGWFVIASAWLGELLGVMILIALAAGVK